MPNEKILVTSNKNIVSLTPTVEPDTERKVEVTVKIGTSMGKEVVTFKKEENLEQIKYTIDPDTGIALLGDTITVTITSDIGQLMPNVSVPDGVEVGTLDGRTYYLRATKPVKGDIVIHIDGFQDLIIPIKFIEEGELNNIIFQVSSCCRRANTGIAISIRAYYNKEFVTCVCNDKGVDVEVINSYVAFDESHTTLKGFTITEFYIECDSLGTKTFTLTGSDGTTTNLEVTFYDMPVNKPMLVDQQHINLLRNETKYLLGELTVVDDDLVVTSTSQHYTVERRANRIYVTGVSEGSGTIKVAHPRYETATIYVSVSKEAYKEVIVKEETYFDLGNAPKVELSYTMDNFVSTVVNTGKITLLTKKVAYILSLKGDGYPMYTTLAYNLCRANELLTSSNLVDNINGSLEVYNAIMSFKDVHDYIHYKELQLLFKLVIEVYRYKGLSKNKILTHIKDLDKREIVSIYLDVVYGVLDSSLTYDKVIGIDKIIGLRATELLSRYVFEARALNI